MMFELRTCAVHMPCNWRTASVPQRKVLEIEGLENLKVEQGFELSDASAERSAAGCAIKLNKEPIAEYLQSNIIMLKWMIANGYGDRRTMERRIAGMEEWLSNPVLLKADK